MSGTETKNKKITLIHKLAYGSGNMLGSGELVSAIEKKDKEKAAHISQRHMSRYSENIDAIRKHFPDYFND